MLPGTLPGQGVKLFEHDALIEIAKVERLTRITEREADPSAACKPTCYLKERRQGLAFTMPVTVERKRFVVVSLAQHPHPGGTVKEGKAGMRCCEPVPTGSPVGSRTSISSASRADERFN
jgi:hypothetical protein